MNDLGAFPLLRGMTFALASVIAGSSAVCAAPATYTPSLSGGLTTAKIGDPSLDDMPAATLTIPAGWKLQGIMLVAPCTTLPWPVIRAYSPDGLMQYRIQPVVAWHWGRSGPSSAGCLALDGKMSAAQFLRYYAGTIPGGVHVVGSRPVTAAFQKFAAHLADSANELTMRNAPAIRTHHTADTAALEIETVNGSFVLDQRLKAVVECAEPDSPQSILGSGCWARVDVLSAPRGRLAALERIVDDNNLPHGVVEPAWGQAFMQRQQRQEHAMMAQLTATEQQESQMLYNQFAQTMQRMRSEHEAFMAQQESSFQSAMANANASMNARSTATSDWVDYSLDRQTVLNPDGSTAKVSSQYSQTWTNGSQWYQTNDPNANPNGFLKGNWSQTTRVHGNGTTY